MIKIKNLLPALALVLFSFPAYASSDLFVSSTGNLGVGTTSPSYALDVYGPSSANTVAEFLSANTDSTNSLWTNTTTGGQAWYVGTAGSSNLAGEAVGDFHIGLNGTGSYLLIGTGGNISILYSLGVTGNLSVMGTATLDGITYPSSATSGGIPYFSSSSTEASSGALTQYAVVLGGGAGGAPTTVSGLGTSGQVLTSNGSGLALRSRP